LDEKEAFESLFCGKVQEGGRRRGKLQNRKENKASIRISHERERQRERIRRIGEEKGLFSERGTPPKEGRKKKKRQ